MLEAVYVVSVCCPVLCYFSHQQSRDSFNLLLMLIYVWIWKILF
jgi:hypothetical protein